jgi:hypothetical protein
VIGISALTDLLKASRSDVAHPDWLAQRRRVSSCRGALLEDSLGGNARTVMLAAISPSAASYAETLSTLRCAAITRRLAPTVTGFGSLPR